MLNAMALLFQNSAVSSYDIPKLEEIVVNITCRRFETVMRINPHQQ